VLWGRTLDWKWQEHNFGLALLSLLQLFKAVQEAALGQTVTPAVLGLAQAALLPPADVYHVDLISKSIR